METEAGERLHEGALVALVGELVTAQERVTVPVNELDGVTEIVVVLPVASPGLTVMLPLFDKEKSVVVVLAGACQKSPHPASRPLTGIATSSDANLAHLPNLIAAPLPHLPDIAGPGEHTALLRRGRTQLSSLRLSGGLPRPAWLDVRGHEPGLNQETFAVRIRSALVRVARLPNQPRRGQVFNGHSYRFENNALEGGRRRFPGKNFADFAVNRSAGQAHVSRFPLHRRAGFGNHAA